MRTDPGFDRETIIRCLEANWRLRVADLAFLPLGLDACTTAYRVRDTAGARWFVKVRLGPFERAGTAIAYLSGRQRLNLD